MLEVRLMALATYLCGLSATALVAVALLRGGLPHLALLCGAAGLLPLCLLACELRRWARELAPPGGGRRPPRL
ncbi:hypothetical protein [Ammonifex thiophilus]|uniref:Uncharacterized protein n=1 Tax=Ammonifex thiophilus TaxID=444093 RepID=A0A3D8P3G1_9THEO|nr:hypothetical protein [Ammonifex thiophilus]RDV81170.1 hypothetical protein DXX99_09775 [Ammonifex thiophilus]